MVEGFCATISNSQYIDDRSKRTGGDLRGVDQ
jgi:hypothetical protein